MTKRLRPWGRRRLWDRIIPMGLVALVTALVVELLTGLGRWLADQILQWMGLYLVPILAVAAGGAIGATLRYLGVGRYGDFER